MPTPQGTRAGMAMVSIEVEAAAGHVLIRVRTVDDVTEPAPLAPGAPFADAEAALLHLRSWLERWIAA